MHESNYSVVGIAYKDFVEYIYSIFLNMYLTMYFFVCMVLFSNTFCSAFFLTPWLRKHILQKSYPNIPKYIQEPTKKQFFGIIGPNILQEKVQTLFELFTGDGVIQGIFINDDKITFAKHLINTDKRINEENQKIRNPHFTETLGMKLLKYFGYLIGITKHNNLGAANTAILPISTPVDENTTAAYALFERDSPYLLHFYHNTSTIKTVKKLHTPYPLSGHSKYSINCCRTRVIESIDYRIFSRKVVYYTMNENLTHVLSEHTIKTRYIPIIHDFLSTTDSIVIVDSPLVFDFAKLFNGKIPIRFDKSLCTYIHVLHKNTGHVSSYKLHSAFYVFHFAKYVETCNQLEIYAPLYDDIDFDTIKIKGRYRKIVIDKCHHTAYVCNNLETEKYNLDFPVEDILGNIILRNIAKRKINGYVKVDNYMAITKKWMFDDIFFCGEPIAVRLNNKNGLIAFGNNNISDSAKNTSGGVVLLNMDDGNIVRILVDSNLTMGFHTVSIVR
uniref:Uncharacterized protein n=1 Tax=viral metagenome TaxID=1070528 RepID=A0A6C0HHD6_9ZZZZ